MTLRGKAVQDGRVNYFSATSLQMGDPEGTDGGCLRKYWYRYLGNLPKPPENKPGVDLHDEAEQYLLTGDRGPCSPLLLAGVHLMPTPGRDLLVEHSLTNFSIVGTPFTGKSDCISNRGTYVNEVGEEYPDPKGTAEVNDWKTTGDLRWITERQKLPDLLQMNVYSAYIGRKWDLEWIRHSHVYFLKKGRPKAKKVTILVPRKGVEKRFARVEGVARTLLDVVKEADPCKVPANTNACQAYRGCPYKDVCTAYTKKDVKAVLASMISPGVTREDDMNLLKKIEQKKGFSAAVAAFQASPYGFPALAGEVAKEFTSLTGRPIPEATGELAGVTVDTFEEFFDYAKQLQDSAKEETGKDSPLPPDAPEPDPAFAADPVPGDLPEGVVNPPPQEEKPKRGRKKKMPGGGTVTLPANENVELAEAPLPSNDTNTAITLALREIAVGLADAAAGLGKIAAYMAEGSK